MTRPAWFTIAAQEFRASRVLLLGATLLGFIPVLYPLLRGEPHAEEMRGPIAIWLCYLVTAVLGYALGDLALAKPLAERRLSFYLSRPVPGWALWWGKLAGGAALILATIALMLAPTLVAGADWSGGGIWEGHAIGLRALSLIAGHGQHASPWLLVVLFTSLLLTPLSLWLVAHALGIALRDRSPLLALDFVLLTATMLFGAYTIDRVLASGAGVLTLVTAGALAALLLIVLAVAGAAALTRGRSDLGRAHRTLSAALWLPSLAVAIMAQLATHWALHPTVGDVTAIHIAQPAPRGPWVRLLTNARGRLDFPYSLLYDSDSGRTVPVAAGEYFEPVVFAADGRHSAWVDAPGARSWQEQPGADVWVVDLDTPELQPRPLKLALRDRDVRLAMSADGAEVAVLHPDRLEVYAASDGRLLNRAALAPPLARVTWRDSGRLLFAADGALLFYRSLDCRSENVCDTLATTRLPRGGKPVQGTRAFRHDDLVVARDGQRLLAATPTDERAQYLLLDGEGGQLAVLGDPLVRGQLGGPRAMRFLADRRIVVLDAESQQPAVLLFDADGGAVRRIAITKPWSGSLGPEVAPGVLLLPPRNNDQPSTLVDVEAGRPMRKVGDLRAATGWYESFLNPSARASGDAPGAGLMVDRSDHALLRLDAATGTTTVVLGRRD